MIRVSNPWMPWQVAIVFGLLAAMFAGGIYSMLTDPNEEMRAFVPCATVGCYLMAAMAINRRIATITPEGVRIRLRPLPVPSQSVRRADIQLCYTRFAASYDDEGVKLGEGYYAGVQNAKGIQVDVFLSFETAAEAAQAAHEIANALGGAPVFLNEPLRDDPSRKWRILFWLALFLTALAAGVVWAIAG